MRRRSALLAFVVVLGMVVIGPGAILADSSRPTVTPIAQDGLSLYSFTFMLDDEIPWNQDQNDTNEPVPYEAALTVYIRSGTFAFFAEGATVQPPPDSTCLEIQTGAKEGDEIYYQVSTPGSEEACVPNCTDWCTSPSLNDPLQALILQAGTVLYLPAETACFICAIAAAANDEPAMLDVTVRTDEADGSWVSVAIPAVAATPEASPEATPAAFRLGKLPMRNPGGCAGRF